MTPTSPRPPHFSPTPKLGPLPGRFKRAAESSPQRNSAAESSPPSKVATGQLRAERDYYSPSSSQVGSPVRGEAPVIQPLPEGRLTLKDGGMALLLSVEGKTMELGHIIGRGKGGVVRAGIDTSEEIHRPIAAKFVTSQESLSPASKVLQIKVRDNLFVLIDDRADCTGKDLIQGLKESHLSVEDKTLTLLTMFRDIMVDVDNKVHSQRLNGASVLALDAGRTSNMLITQDQEQSTISFRMGDEDGIVVCEYGKNYTAYARPEHMDPEIFKKRSADTGSVAWSCSSVLRANLSYLDIPIPQEIDALKTNRYYSEHVDTFNTLIGERTLEAPLFAALSEIISSHTQTGSTSETTFPELSEDYTHEAPDEPHLESPHEKGPSARTTSLSPPYQRSRLLFA